MAFQNAGFTFFYTLVDTGGNAGTLSFKATAGDYTTALLDLETVRAAIEGATRCALRSYGIRDTFEEDAFVYPAGNVELEDKASITVNLEGGVKKANVRIPAPVDAMMTATSGPGFNVVNGLAASVTALLDVMQTTGGVVTISDGETVSDTQPFAGGKRVSAKSTRG